MIFSDRLQHFSSFPGYCCRLLLQTPRIRRCSHSPHHFLLDRGQIGIRKLFLELFPRLAEPIPPSKVHNNRQRDRNDEEDPEIWRRQLLTRARIPVEHLVHAEYRLS